MEICRGRTRGYLTITNDVIDGLLELGTSGIDALGFYCALRRFVDRRSDADSEAAMDWSVQTFCRKFNVGKDRFYRLMDLLWAVGLVDVIKETTDQGWQNRYMVHDYADYEGPIRVVREGTFRTRRRTEASYAGEGIPETGIPPEGGIPESGIPASGIPETGMQEKTTTRKEQLSEKNKSTVSGTLSYPATNVAVPEDSNGKESGPFSSSSNEEKEKGRASRAREFQALPDRTTATPLQSSERRIDGQEEKADAFRDSASHETPKTENDSSDINNRMLIAELVKRLHRIPGIEELRGHWPLIGRAYNEYGYQCVRAALEDLEAEYRGAELLGKPYPDERELPKLLFKKCRWNAKRLAAVLDKPHGNGNGNGGRNKVRKLSFSELERLGCVIERAPDGRPIAVRVPNDEVKRRVRAARQQT